MDRSLGNGFMAVFAVSGSVVLLAMQVHKRLLSKFMEKMEFEIINSTGRVKDQETKKRVRFAEDVVGSTANQRGSGKKYTARLKAVAPPRNNGENLEGMPPNWQAMYKGILQCRNLQRGYY